ncbi:MAG: hypothetical protein PW786_09335 [Arachidicoccus sp.]|nr:hypothetical protein [Arachidicoccus sp.]
MVNVHIVVDLLAIGISWYCYSKYDEYSEFESNYEQYQNSIHWYNGYYNYMRSKNPNDMRKLMKKKIHENNPTENKK